MFSLTLITGMLLGASVAFAQTATSLAFDVASVKPSPPLDIPKMTADMQAGKMPRYGPHVDGSRAEYIHVNLKDLIALAYKVKAYQITSPEWMATTPFDIVAKMPDGASKDDAPAMLQGLLLERFKLVVHRETQEHPVLALVVGKDGPKLQPSPATGAPIDKDAPLKPGETQVEGPDGPMRISKSADNSMTINMGAKGIVTQRMDMQSQMLYMESSKVSMSGFADLLTNIVQMGSTGGRRVVDETDLKGDYQVAVEIPLAGLMQMAKAHGMDVGAAGGGAASNLPASAASDPVGDSGVFASVQKLGLKLEPRKAKVEQLIIDHVEKTPTAN